MSLGEWICSLRVKSSRCADDEINLGPIKESSTKPSTQLNVEDVLGIIMEYSSSTDLVSGWSRTDNLCRKVSIVEWERRCKNMTNLMTTITQFSPIKLMKIDTITERPSEEIFFKFEQVLKGKKVVEWKVSLNDTKDGSDAYMLPVREEIHKSTGLIFVKMGLSLARGNFFFRETDDYLFTGKNHLILLNKELSSDEKCILLYGYHLLNEASNKK